ncbi:aminopeptidase P N-terminal domain-containing protein [Sciscionella sediminilitoris]|uniref:aminopeptidase P N-terminal domain-containing protein n=1 Tax=Sciscionella sediminilitoris TaxID=1445613 RepID=UPI000B2194C1|nr:aminopeptidase P N-terminal domain-containing protein [Sciscionella sp. SE31]
MSWTDEELRDLLTATGRRTPLELVRAMTEGWRVPAAEIAEWAGAAPRRRRRAAIAADFAGTMLVIPNGRAPWRTGDLTYPFRPATDFLWLAGEADPGSVLVIDGAGEAILFVDERPALGHPLAYLDAARGAICDGQPEPLSALGTRLGLAVRPIGELDAVLRGAGPARTVRGLDPLVDSLVPEDGQELEKQLARRRLIKDDYEIARLRDTAQATVAGFRTIARSLPEVLEYGEPFVEGLFTRTAHAHGHGVAFTPVCGGGARSTILHWFRNDHTIEPGDILLLDAGVEGAERYGSDVARVFPVSGKFSAVQREVHAIISAAHQATLEAVRPGVTFEELSETAAAVLIDGLKTLGVLPNRSLGNVPEEVLARRWSLHSIGHMLGIDVHDCTVVFGEYFNQPLVEGHVLAIEPGLYFSPYDQFAPDHLRGIGMRIEDDLVVTSNGCEVLSAGLPSSAPEFEDWLQTLS